MKWLFSMSMVVMPWLMVALLSWIHPEMSRESIFLIVGVLFGIVLWPLLFLIIPIFWGVESERMMAKAEPYIVMARAKYRCV